MKRQPNTMQLSFAEMAGEQEAIRFSIDQQEAVDHGEGPILVVAGAGTGKTTVLASRIVRLLQEGIAEPSEILAVTYTRNSARDLLKRITRLWKGRDDPATVTSVAEAGLKIGTFHAYCYWLLRAAGQRFDLIDEQDLYVLLRRQLENLKLHYYVKAASPGEFLRGLNEFFERCHDELRTPDDYDAYVRKLESKQLPLPRVTSGKKAHEMPEEEVLGRCREIARVFRLVEDMLLKENLGTYSHVITRAVHLLSDAGNSEHLQRAQKGARFLLIDEFQDSNVAQIELARLLAGKKGNVFAVGDPDQAIYRFRGATAGTFDRFLRTFGIDKVKRVTMAANRRSTEPVLKAAYEVISRNPEITSVELPGGERWQRTPLQHKRESAEPVPVSPIVVRAWDTHRSEAVFVASEIKRLHQTEGRPWRHFAVLYRNHRSRNELVKQLAEHAIPFTVTGLDLLDTPEVRDVLAGLRAVEGNDSAALLRVAALPRFSVSGEELRNVLAHAEECTSLEPVLEKVTGGSEVLTALAEARHQVQRLNDKALAACGIVQKCFGIAGSSRAGAFTEFVQAWSRKPKQVSLNGTLTEFFDYLKYFIEGGGTLCAPETSADDVPAPLQMEAGQLNVAEERDDCVRLVTVHSAKGLEFPVVFVLRVVRGQLPGKYHEDLVEFPDELRDPDSRQPDAPSVVHAQEERRLFYVAVTRAEDQLILCGKKGTGKKEPSTPGYLRDLVTAGTKSIPRYVDFGILPTDEEVAPRIHAAKADTRIAEWVALPALPETMSKKLSARAIENYKRCPLSYKLSQEWKLPEEPGANPQFGSAMHLTLLAYFDGVRKGRPMEQPQVLQYFVDEFAKAKIDDPTQRRLYEREGKDQLKAFLNSPAAHPRGRVVMLEQRFGFDVDGSKVVGRIDRVDEEDDGYVVVDYKTGRPKTQNAADESLQLSIYALAMNKQKPVKRLVFQNLQDNSTVESSRSPEQLQETEFQIVEVGAGIARGEFEAKPDKHCVWCGYREICPAVETSLPERSTKG